MTANDCYWRRNPNLDYNWLTATPSFDRLLQRRNDLLRSRDMKSGTPPTNPSQEAASPHVRESPPSTTPHPPTSSTSHTTATSSAASTSLASSTAATAASTLPSVSSSGSESCSSCSGSPVQPEQGNVPHLTELVGSDEEPEISETEETGTAEGRRTERRRRRAGFPQASPHPQRSWQRHPSTENPDADSDDSGSSPRLWRFLGWHLRGWPPGDLIQLLDRQQGLFLLSQPEELARLWGQVKRNSAMTYEKFSRGLRYYYKTGVLTKVRGKLKYRFNTQSPEWRQIWEMKIPTSSSSSFFAAPSSANVSQTETPETMSNLPAHVPGLSSQPAPHNVTMGDPGLSRQHTQQSLSTIAGSGDESSLERKYSPPLSAFPRGGSLPATASAGSLGAELASWPSDLVTVKEEDVRGPSACPLLPGGPQHFLAQAGLPGIAAFQSERKCPTPPGHSWPGASALPSVWPNFLDTESGAMTATSTSTSWAAAGPKPSQPPGTAPPTCMVLSTSNAPPSCMAASTCRATPTCTATSTCMAPPPTKTPATRMARSTRMVPPPRTSTPTSTATPPCGGTHTCMATGSRTGRSWSHEWTQPAPYPMHRGRDFTSRHHPYDLQRRPQHSRRTCHLPIESQGPDRASVAIRNVDPLRVPRPSLERSSELVDPAYFYSLQQHLDPRVQVSQSSGTSTSLEPLTSTDSATSTFPPTCMGSPMSLGPPVCLATPSSSATPASLAPPSCMAPPSSLTSSLSLTLPSCQAISRGTESTVSMRPDLTDEEVLDMF